MRGTAHEYTKKAIVFLKEKQLILLVLGLLAVIFPQQSVNLAFIIFAVTMILLVLYKAAVYMLKISVFMFKLTIGAASTIVAVSGLFWIFSL